MNLWPPYKGNDPFLQAVSMTRRGDASEIANLNTRLVRGRFRTDRATPSSHTDVTAGIDREGDIVRTGAYEYIVVNDAGTLKWARQALDVAW